MKMTMRILAAACAFLLCAPFALRAQSGAALGFTCIERSPRASGLAGAGAASQKATAHAGFARAAQLSFLPELGEGALGLQLWEPTNEVDKTTNFNAVLALRFVKLGVALAGAYQSGVKMGTFVPSDRLLSAGLSYAINDRLSLGLNARYAAQALSASAQVSGFSADFSLVGLITPELSAALGVANLGNRVQGSASTYPQPARANAGLAWNLAFSPEHTLELMLDGEYYFNGPAAGALGAEYTFRDLLFLRAGYRYAGADCIIPSHASLGAGLRFHGLGLDISWLTASDILANTLNVGLSYRF